MLGALDASDGASEATRDDVDNVTKRVESVESVLRVTAQCPLGVRVCASAGDSMRLMDVFSMRVLDVLAPPGAILVDLQHSAARRVHFWPIQVLIMSSTHPLVSVRASVPHIPNIPASHAHHANASYADILYAVSMRSGSPLCLLLQSACTNESRCLPAVLDVTQVDESLHTVQSFRDFRIRAFCIILNFFLILCFIILLIDKNAL